jgi:hypothetical protein
MDNDSPSLTFTVPERIEGSMTGTEFSLSIERVSGAPRELAIYQQFALGNIPSFMRSSKLLRLADDKHRLVLEVFPDVLCIGTDEDFFRTPMTPDTAQKIADLYSATLITPFLNDQIWRLADVQLNPQTMPPTHEMVTTKWFSGHNEKIEKLRAGRPGLIAGIKKNVCIANSLMLPEFKNKRRVAIHGWHYTNGKPIQGLNPSKGMAFNHTHDDAYVDYSHGVYLASQTVLLDDCEMTFLEVALNPEMAPLVNGTDGVLTFLRYPT